MTEYIRLNPRVFIRPPYHVCPKCQSNQYGLLNISRNRYTRRCKICWNTESYSLPKIKKKIFYLDQFAISNMMKAINPLSIANRKGKIDSFWRDLFEKLDVLCKLQILICPYSYIHTQESIVSSHFEKLRSMYQLLNCNVSFQDLSYIHRFHIYEHAKWWIKGQKEPFKPNLDRKTVFYRPVDVWSERYSISVNFRMTDKMVDEIRKSRKKTYGAIKEVFEQWQKDSDKDFHFWFKEEILGFGKAIIKQYSDYLSFHIRIRMGLESPTLGAFLPPESSYLIHMLQDLFRNEGVKENELWDKTVEYLQSPSLELIPFNCISAMMYAAIARRAAHGGQKKPPNQGTANDIEVISTLMPYCDAMFIDKECHSILNEKPLRSKLNFGTQLFSMRNKEYFIEYLEKLKDEIPDEHIKIIHEVYGESWIKPFTSMYQSENKNLE